MSNKDRLLAKKIIVEIIRQAGGKWIGKTKLYKAFYFAHLYYFESAPDYLSDWPIVRMPNGPGIDSGDELLRELAATGVLTRDFVPEGPYRASRYHLSERQLPGEPLSKDSR